MPLDRYDHDFILDLMKICHYSPDPKGACVGVTQMGIQAFLSGEIDIYNTRILKLYDLWKTLKTGKEAKVTSDEYAKYLDSMVALKFNPDYIAFFDGIAIYQDPSEFPHLFSEITLQRDTENISKIGASKKMDERGGLYNIKHDISLYTRDELSNFFQLVQAHAGKQKLAITLDLYKPHSHQVAVCFDGQTKKWFMIDPNDLPIREVSLLDLSQDVFNAHTFDDHLDKFAFSIKTFALGHEKESIVKMTEELNKNSIFQTLQKITPQKARYQCCHNNLLHIATDAGNTEFVEHIVDENLIDTNLTDWFDYTPLHYAVVNKNPEITHALISKQHVASDPQNKKGQSPLYIAAKNNYTDIAKICLENGANPYLASKNKTNPITIAAIEGNLSMLNLYVEMGYNIFLSDDNGKTCYDYAIDYGHSHILDFINSTQKRKITKTINAAFQKHSILSTSIPHERPIPTSESPQKKRRHI